MSGMDNDAGNIQLFGRGSWSRFWMTAEIGKRIEDDRSSQDERSCRAMPTVEIKGADSKKW